jgi:hypothetical protein
MAPMRQPRSLGGGKQGTWALKKITSIGGLKSLAGDFKPNSLLARRKQSSLLSLSPQQPKTANRLWKPKSDPVRKAGEDSG